jgi:ergothioneine biosynthesis protein EgtB
VKLDCTPAADAAPGARSLRALYDEVRAQTERLCRPLAVEDYGVQSMPDASPAKWHLAHTTWFFETFVLAGQPDHRPFHPFFGFLFNSYYNAVGQRVARAQRGLLSRPTVEEVYRYRAHVDERMRRLLDDASASTASLVVLGLNHEQQHQELLLTDIHHAFSCNPLKPAYRRREGPANGRPAPRARWVDCPGGVHEIGHTGDGFAYDNEGPRHRIFLEAFRLQSRLVTCGEYLAFMEDGGYRRPELWLSDGWDACRAKGWTAPLYWEPEGGRWQQQTLNGLHPVGAGEPVCHISYYEADAFARWAGARLPTEAEHEAAANTCPLEGSFVDADCLHPQPAGDAGGLRQIFGEAWQWTASPYVGYPGYRPAEGALGEYNGKFMVNQLVLRGGSCLTPRSHFRRTYRNFFPPEARWQMSGIRLALDGGE